jgi:hypothetical protein
MHVREAERFVVGIWTALTTYIAAADRSVQFGRPTTQITETRTRVEDSRAQIRSTALSTAAILNIWIAAGRERLQDWSEEPRTGGRG